MQLSNLSSEREVSPPCKKLKTNLSGAQSSKVTFEAGTSLNGKVQIRPKFHKIDQVEIKRLLLNPNL
jgi:hypothetical protein